MVKPNAGLKTQREHFEKYNRVRAFDLHGSKIHSVAWNCDGRRLATGSLDKRICVAALDNYRLRSEFIGQGHSDQVDQVNWHHTNPDVLASAGGDRSVRIWDIKTKKGIHTINTKGQNINVGFSPDGNTVAIGDKDDKINFVDTRTWKHYHTLTFYKSETNEFAWDHTGQFFFAASSNGRIFIHAMKADAQTDGSDDSFPEWEQVHTLQAHPQQANCISIKMDPSGETFAVGAGDALITIWDLRNMCCVRTIDRLDYPVRAVSFSYDGKLLAAGSEDHFIDIANVETGERVFDLRSDAETYTLAWHPTQYLLAFASSDSYRDGGSVKLFGLSPEQI